jgi:hypothetical protein
MHHHRQQLPAKPGNASAQEQKRAGICGSTVQSQTQTQTVTTELQYIAVTALPVKR